MKKQAVIELLDTFPSEVDTEELIYRLYLKAKLERAEADIKAGKTISHEEVCRQTREWFKSSGRQRR